MTKIILYFLIGVINYLGNALILKQQTSGDPDILVGILAVNNKQCIYAKVYIT